MQTAKISVGVPATFLRSSQSDDEIVPTTNSFAGVVRSTTSEVNEFLKCIRVITSLAGRWISISEEFLKAIKYTKAISTFRAIFAIRKLFDAIVKVASSENIILRATACWRVIKNSKKIVFAIAWISNLAKDLKLLSQKFVNWTKQLSYVQIPFQVISFTVCLIKLGKLSYIWFDLERYQLHLRKNRYNYTPFNCQVVCNYLGRTKERIGYELAIPNTGRYERYVNSMQELLNKGTENDIEHAEDKCELLMQALRARAKAQVTMAALECVAKTCDLASSIVACALARAVSPKRLLSTATTAFKIGKFLYAKNDGTKAFWELFQPKGFHSGKDLHKSKGFLHGYAAKIRAL